MAKTIVANPPAELDSRPSDIALTPEQFLKISVFAHLKNKPSVEKFPGTIVLRRYKKNEAICRQGEAGWTAFYVLTTEDTIEILESQLKETVAKGGHNQVSLNEELTRLAVRAAKAPVENPETDRRPAATAFLSLARPAKKKVGGTGWRGASPAKAPGKRGGRMVPIDAPQDIDYESQQAPIFEGDIFGEMSCLYRTLRSATIVADEDCYVLEFLRNILDQFQKDAAYKARMDANYRKRVLELHLHNLPIFDALTEEQVNALRDSVELVAFTGGEVIFDENDRSDSMYVIRNGVVKVKKFVSELLAVGEVNDWAKLAAALRPAPAVTPPNVLRELLPEPVRAMVGEAGIAPEDRQELILALNDLIKGRALLENKDVKPLIGSDAFRARAGSLLERRQTLQNQKKELPDPELRRLNRMLVEALLPGLLRSRETPLGPETVLSYLSRGEFLGEMGLMTGQPRSATCMAYSHPTALGQAELVRINAETFRHLIEESPKVREAISKEVAKRAERTTTAVRAVGWDDREHLLLSDRFEQYGLIQGQRLMLIDLDRCTRCDECVKACVNSHDDGRSRLFLDGPRLGKYLVPTTCRSCLDPVCMIGCPVGSIHRGNNREIVIEDWCIGCGLCANQCPYGSIQMHDVGIVPLAGYGWRYLPADLAGEQWHQPTLRDRRWLAGAAPFNFDREVRATLAECYRNAGRPTPSGDSPLPVCFRYEFNLDAAQEGSRFRVELTTSDAEPQVFINGKPIVSPDKPKRGAREYVLAATDKLVRAGRNVLAIRVSHRVKNDLPEASRSLMMQVRLDEVRQPRIPLGILAEVSQKLVEETAVVCDLCSSIPSQVPACVNSCPHDAAMRVDARFEFPTG
jgi:CRP-like cAMP-binding protein